MTKHNTNDKTHIHSVSLTDIDTDGALRETAERLPTRAQLLSRGAWAVAFGGLALGALPGRRAGQGEHIQARARQADQRRHRDPQLRAHARVSAGELLHAGRTRRSAARRTGRAGEGRRLARARARTGVQTDARPPRDQGTELQLPRDDRQPALVPGDRGRVRGPRRRRLQGAVTEAPLEGLPGGRRLDPLGRGPSRRVDPAARQHRPRRARVRRSDRRRQDHRHRQRHPLRAPPDPADKREACSVVHWIVRPRRDARNDPVQSCRPNRADRAVVVLVGVGAGLLVAPGTQSSSGAADNASRAAAGPGGCHR